MCSIAFHIRAGIVLISSQPFADARRTHLPVLFLIALLHLILIFGWSIKKHNVSVEVEPSRLWVWSVTPFVEAKPPDKHQSSDPSPHVPKQRADRRALNTSATPSARSPEQATDSTSISSPTPSVASPVLDLDSIRKQALEIDRHREISPIERLHEKEFTSHTMESVIDDAATRGRRQDCQTAYAGAGLLGLVPLVYDTLTDKGCKWK